MSYPPFLFSAFAVHIILISLFHFFVLSIILFIFSSFLSMLYPVLEVFLYSMHSPVSCLSFFTCYFCILYLSLLTFPLISVFLSSIRSLICFSVHHLEKELSISTCASDSPRLYIIYLHPVFFLFVCASYIFLHSLLFLFLLSVHPFGVYS